MKRKPLLLLILGLLLIISSSLSGCLGGDESDDDDEKNDKDGGEVNIYKIGNEWVYNIDDEDLGSGTMAMEMTSESYMHNEIETAVVSLDFLLTWDPEEDDDMIYDEMTGSGTGYIRKADGQLIYQEFELILRMKYSEDDDWTEVYN